MEGAEKISAARTECSKEQMEMMMAMQDGAEATARSEGDMEEEGGLCCMETFMKMTMCTKTCMLKKLGWMSEEYELQPDIIEECVTSGPLADYYSCEDPVGKCMMLGDALNHDNMEEFVSNLEEENMEYFMSLMGAGEETASARMPGGEEMSPEMFLNIARNAVKLGCLQVRQLQTKYPI